MSSDPASDIGVRLMTQILDLWVRPELVRRGRPDGPIPPRALVVFTPGQPVRIAFDEECGGWIAEVRATGPIAVGQPITRADFSAVEGLRPAGIDPNAGWIGFVSLGAEIFVGFDFRRNRARAGAFLARAAEFRSAAAWSLGQGHLGPCLESAYAAAELAVTAHLMVFAETRPAITAPARSGGSSGQVWGMRPPSTQARSRRYARHARPRATPSRSLRSRDRRSKSYSRSSTKCSGRPKNVEQNDSLDVRGAAKPIRRRRSGRGVRTSRSHASPSTVVHAKGKQDLAAWKTDRELRAELVRCHVVEDRMHTLAGSNLGASWHHPADEKGNSHLTPVSIRARPPPPLSQRRGTPSGLHRRPIDVSTLLDGVRRALAKIACIKPAS